MLRRLPKRMIIPRTRELDWNVRGLSVTAPHKTAVMEQLDWIEPAAQGNRCSEYHRDPGRCAARLQH